VADSGPASAAVASAMRRRANVMRDFRGVEATARCGLRGLEKTE
jgi:hypothetical protein